jgi:hypothetical protein
MRPCSLIKIDIGEFYEKLYVSFDFNFDRQILTSANISFENENIWERQLQIET